MAGPAKSAIESLCTTALCVLVAVVGLSALNSRVVRLETRSAGHTGNQVAIRLTSPWSAGTTFDFPRLAPGGTASTIVDLTVSSETTPAVTLTTRATSSSLLDQDHLNGLQMAVEACSVPWQAVSEAAPTRSLCAGRRRAVLAARPVTMSNVPLPDLATVATHHLLISWTLPTSAGNEFQGLSSSIDYTFHAA